MKRTAVAVLVGALLAVAATTTSGARAADAPPPAPGAKPAGPGPGAEPVRTPAPTPVIRPAQPAQGNQPLPVEEPKAAPAAPAAPATKADPELERLIDGVTAYYDKMQHLKAKFRQVVKQKTLARTKKATGTIEFAKPGRMRWEYQRPERVLYVSDGETLWTYQPEDALVYKARIQGSRLYHALRFLFGMGDLRATFDVAMGPAHGPDTAFLVLTPKGGQQDYQDLSLVVDRKTFEIRESFLTDPLGNVTQYIFDELDYTSEIPEGRFGFTPPPGATVQEL
jgi:outer membrane lipoprotein carrier protein